MRIIPELDIIYTIQTATLKTVLFATKCFILTYLLLSFNDVRKLRVGDSGIQLTLHQGCSFVVFDIAQVSALGHFNVFGKPLHEETKNSLKP